MYIDFLCDERHFFTLLRQGVIDLPQAAVKATIVNKFRKTCKKPNLDFRLTFKISLIKSFPRWIPQKRF